MNLYSLCLYFITAKTGSLTLVAFVVYFQMHGFCLGMHALVQKFYKSSDSGGFILKQSIKQISEKRAKSKNTRIAGGRARKTYSREGLSVAPTHLTWGRQYFS